MRTLVAVLSMLVASSLGAQPADTLFQNFSARNPASATETESAVALTLVDQSGKPWAGLELWLKSPERATVYHAKTDARGTARFLLPIGCLYELSTAEQPAFEQLRTVNDSYVESRRTLSYVKRYFTEWRSGDTIHQKVGPEQQPTRDRILTILTVVNFGDKPLPGEPLYFVYPDGTVYAAVSDVAGEARLMLPKGATVRMNTAFSEGLAEVKLPDDERAGFLRTRFTTLGSKAILKRRAERARIAAERDSLARLYHLRDSIKHIRDSIRAMAGEGHFLNKASFSNDPAAVIRQINQRAAYENEILRDNPQYFEQSGEALKAALYRNRAMWANKVIVTDLTGSMRPYMDEVLLWHALAVMPGEHNRYLFFNDGDRRAEKPIGATRGFYTTGEAKLEALLNTMQQTVDNGGGGESEENDIEALIEASRMMGEGDELILIADNYSDVRDMELLPQLRTPVRVVLAGAEDWVNEQYLQIAYATGGSLHTLTSDILELQGLNEGELLRIDGQLYRLSGGLFLKE